MEGIKEVIVVEGRDDTNAVKRAVVAETIETHGYGIREETWKSLEKAYEIKGLIILTDPDYAGEEIRKRLKRKFPNAKHAYIERDDANKDNDIGIENAIPEVIIKALSKAKAEKEEIVNNFTVGDLEEFGLIGQEDSSERRRNIGRTLGIGYGNGKSFLKKLNAFGIKKEEFYEALQRKNYK